MDAALRLPSLSALLKTADIQPRVQQHLLRVYSTLAAGVLLTAATIWAATGPLADLLSPIAAGNMRWLPLLGMVGCIMWLSSLSEHDGLGKRLAVFSVIVSLQGLSITSLISLVAAINPTIPLMAALGASASFVCFSGFALLSKRRSLLFLGGLVSSALSWLLLARFATIFMGAQASAAVFSVELYGGLAAFCAYVCAHTQQIVEQAEGGSTDFVQHALRLYLDLIAIFVRLAIILAQNQQRRAEKDRQEKRRGNSAGR